MMPKKILIITEYVNTNQILELFACAAKIKTDMSTTTQAILINNNKKDVLESLRQYNNDIINIELSHNLYNCDPFILWNILSPIVDTYSPELIITSHSSFGLCFIPLFCTKMKASCITGVKNISCNDQELLFTRAIVNGKFETQVRSERNVTGITIMPGAFTNKLSTGNKGKLTHIKSEKNYNGRIILKSIKQPDKSDCSFDHADVIVAAGRGIGDIENLYKIKQFASIFMRSAIAGSRPLIDMGWLPYPMQVGITGKTVEPPVYIACGISGSSQHIAGMSGAEYIIAINSDPHASIFSVADLCIVADLFLFIDAVMHDDTIVSAQGRM
jgi:electron transfer flavoprotein alpha subunit